MGEAVLPEIVRPRPRPNLGVVAGPDPAMLLPLKIIGSVMPPRGGAKAVDPDQTSRFLQNGRHPPEILNYVIIKR